jgi:c-di-GMP-binding flagellar brake protein YcgR
LCNPIHALGVAPEQDGTYNAPLEEAGQTELMFPMRLSSGANSLLFWAGAAFVILLCGAVTIEVFRKRARRKRRIAADWEVVRKITAEKRLCEEEWNLLSQIVKRWAPSEPLHAITGRHSFDQMVASELELLESQGRTDELEKVALQMRDIRERLALDYIPFGQRIESTRELYIDQLMQIATREDNEKRRYRVRVAAVDEAYFGVTLDSQEIRGPRIVPEEVVSFWMWREEDARYEFQTRFARFEEQAATWWFWHTSEFDRKQSRAHFRIRYEQAMTVGILNAPVDGAVEDLSERPVVTRLRGRTVNLSAGGVAMIVNQPLPKQVFLRVSFVLSEVDPNPIAAEARIVASTALGAGHYLVRACYVGMPDEMRDKIAHYVHLQQQRALTIPEQTD